MRRLLIWIGMNSLFGTIFFILWASSPALNQQSWWKLWINYVIIFNIVALPAEAVGTYLDRRLKVQPLLKRALIIYPFSLAACLCGQGLVHLIAFFQSGRWPPSIEIVLNIAVCALFTLFFTLGASRMHYLESILLRREAENDSVPAFENSEPEPSEIIPAPNGLSIREGLNYHYILYDDIIYLSSHGRSTVVHTTGRAYQTGSLLKSLEGRLPQTGFLRIHKSYVVNLRSISHIQYFIGGSWIAYLRDGEDTTLPVGRKYATFLKTRMGIERAGNGSASQLN